MAFQRYYLVDVTGYNWSEKPLEIIWQLSTTDLQTFLDGLKRADAWLANPANYEPWRPYLARRHGLPNGSWIRIGRTWRELTVSGNDVTGRDGFWGRPF